MFTKKFFFKINEIVRKICGNKRLVLGIESTFDDSGAAVIDENGQVLGESLISQTVEHKHLGGVHPKIATRLHEVNLPIVVNKAMERAGINYKDLSAIATATQPGAALSLQAGLIFSQQLIVKHNLPFIPVHHMEAHALTIRSIDQVEFPFLVLLVSGGHCLLCLAQDLGRYKILGHVLDEPPGAVFDKIARELVKVSPQECYSYMSGGIIIEKLAERGDSSRYIISVPMSTGRHKSCNFSFSGLQTQVLRLIDRLKNNDELDTNACCDIAASFQKIAIQHIVNQLHRGILFCQMENMLHSPVLVLSGGVAANSHLREAITKLCDTLNVKLLCPPMHLCTDNGIMIAWAGMEYLKKGMGVAGDPMKVRFEPKSPLGEFIGEQIVLKQIKLPRMN